jgi:hypothetical protein
MTTHSAIDEAHQAIDIARYQPLGTGHWDNDLDEWVTNPDKGMVEAIDDLLTDTRGRLRRVFVGGQIGDAPDDWRIDGLLYKRLDDMLIEATGRLERRYRMALINLRKQMAEKTRRRGLGIRTAIKRVAGKGTRPDPPKWFDAGDYESWTRLRQSGFEVRLLEIGRRKIYQAKG